MICQNCKKQIPPESVYCMFCGAPIFSIDRDAPKPLKVQPVRRSAAPLDQAAPPTPRSCVTCGTLLPDGYEGDVCDACLFVSKIASQLPDDDEPAQPAPAKDFRLDLDFDLDEEYRDPPAAKARRGYTKGKPAKWLLPVLLGIVAVAVLVVGAWLLPPLLKGRDNTPAVSAPSQEEQDALSFAQEMVKAAARDPSSVHFDRATVSVTRDLTDYRVTQTFERADASGKLLSASYEAVLTLSASEGKKYTPLLLKVDNETIYDYR